MQRKKLRARRFGASVTARGVLNWKAVPSVQGVEEVTKNGSKYGHGKGAHKCAGIASLQPGRRLHEDTPTVQPAGTGESLAFGPRGLIALTTLVMAMALTTALFFVVRVGRTMLQVQAGFQNDGRAMQSGSDPAVPRPPALVLHGIGVTGGAPEAVINGQTVHEGDIIEGARVTAIKDQYVKLRFAGRNLVLRMP